MENPIAGQEPVKKPDAGQTPVETTPVSLTPEQAEAMAKALEEATALAAKKSEEAENYKRGMLKAKGKLVEQGIEDEDDDKPQVLTADEVARIAQAEIAKVVQPKAEDEVEKLRTTNSELINALRNRPPAPTSVGANADKPEPKTHPYWSEAQLADLKARGLDPDVVYKNMQGAGAPGSMAPNPLPPTE